MVNKLTEEQKVAQGVILFLTHHRETLLKRINPLLLQKEELLKTEDHTFHPEINEQFETLIRREIADQIALDLNFKADDVYLIVETLDVPQFISGFNENPN